jgi:hypothetical protein
MAPFKDSGVGGYLERDPTTGGGSDGTCAAGELLIRVPAECVMFADAESTAGLQGAGGHALGDLKQVLVGPGAKRERERERERARATESVGEINARAVRICMCEQLSRNMAHSHLATLSCLHSMLLHSKIHSNLHSKSPLAKW